MISMDFEPGRCADLAVTSEYPKCAPWFFDLETKTRDTIDKQVWSSLSGPYDVALGVKHWSTRTLIYGLRSGGVVLCDKRGGGGSAVYKPGKVRMFEKRSGET